MLQDGKRLGKIERVLVRRFRIFLAIAAQKYFSLGGGLKALHLYTEKPLPNFPTYFKREIPLSR